VSIIAPVVIATVHFLIMKYCGDARRSTTPCNLHSDTTALPKDGRDVAEL
jgi:hypothetical protein